MWALQAPEPKANDTRTKARAPARTFVTKPAFDRDLKRSMNSGATALDRVTQTRAKAALGFDFANVRVHADEAAVALTDAVDARAFTVGRDVFFGRNEYRPSASDGRRLVMHELAHVVQQRTAWPDPLPSALSVSRPGEAAEREADRIVAGEAAAPPAAAIRVSVQRQPKPGSSDAPKGIDAPAKAGGADIVIEFYAFIPGSLGKPFKDYNKRKGLANQAAFDTAVAAVKGTWLPEPLYSGKDWYFETDNREFGTGKSHRVGFKGTIERSKIGSLGNSAKIFDHWCNPSVRVRTKDTGFFTSGGETGSLDGPHSHTATVRNQKETRTDSGGASHIKTQGAAAYAFMETLSPDIDYDVNFSLVRGTGSAVHVGFDVTHNDFPFYEVLVNGRVLHRYASADEGPGPVNLNSSTTTHHDLQLI